MYMNTYIHISIYIRTIMNILGWYKDTHTEFNNHTSLIVLSHFTYTCMNIVINTFINNLSLSERNTVLP